MQNSWCFVEDPALRDRLKEAKGRCAVTSFLCRPPAAQKAAASLPGVSVAGKRNHQCRVGSV